MKGMYQLSEQVAEEVLGRPKVPGGNFGRRKSRVVASRYLAEKR
jgi:hypothetical protein